MPNGHRAPSHYGTAHYGTAPHPISVVQRRRCDNRAALKGQPPQTSRKSLATEKELSDFLKSAERRAFKRTAFAVRDDDAALDIVQDAMIRLAEKYGERPPAELPLIFARILSNATLDWYRRQKVRHAAVVNFSELESGAESADFDLLETLEAANGAGDKAGPPDSLSSQQSMALIEAQVAALPARQREAFLLRYWEELDVAQTALVMGCSQGSVKTHCSRAVHALATALTAKGLKP